MSWKLTCLRKGFRQSPRCKVQCSTVPATSLFRGRQCCVFEADVTDTVASAAGLLSNFDIVAVARALCGSSAASWSWCTRLLQLWHRQISCEARLLAPLRGFRRMAFASPLRIAYVHIATRAMVRATALLHRKIVSILEYPNVK